MKRLKKGQGVDPSTPRMECADAGEHLGTSPIIGDHEARVQPVLVRAGHAAKLAGVSTSTWWKLHAMGRTPEAIRLAGTRWNLLELQRWLEAGAPTRDRWEAMGRK